MDASSLKKRIRKKLESEHLTEEQLTKLQAMIGENTARNSANFSRRKLALVFLFGATGVYLYRRSNESAKQSIVGANLAQEVINDYLHMKPLEFRSTSMTDAKSFFSAFDFRIENSELLNGYSLFGGRYCKLQGKPSAELRYRDSAGRAAVVHQAQFEDSFFGVPSVDNNERPFIFHQNGVSVKLWSERDLVFALAISCQDNKQSSSEGNRDS